MKIITAEELNEAQRTSATFERFAERIEDRVIEKMLSFARSESVWQAMRDLGWTTKSQTDEVQDAMVTELKRRAGVA